MQPPHAHHCHIVYQERQWTLRLQRALICILICISRMSHALLACASGLTSSAVLGAVSRILRKLSHALLACASGLNNSAVLGAVSRILKRLSHALLACARGLTSSAVLGAVSRRAAKRCACWQTPSMVSASSLLFSSAAAAAARSTDCRRGWPGACSGCCLSNRAMHTCSACTSHARAQAVTQG